MIIILICFSKNLNNVISFIPLDAIILNLDNRNIENSCPSE